MQFFNSRQLIVSVQPFTLSIMVFILKNSINFTFYDELYTSFWCVLSKILLVKTIFKNVFPHFSRLLTYYPRLHF